MQSCGRCKISKNEDEFSPSYRGTPGTWCRSCFAEYVRHRKRGTTPSASATHALRRCDWCGENYSPKQLKNRASSYCSKLCKDRARNHERQAQIDAAKPARACLHCGSDIAKTRRADARFCSEDCNSAAHAVTRKVAKRAGLPKRAGDLISRSEIAERDNWRCGICGGRVAPEKKHPDPMYGSIDHIIPLAQGGTNDLTNLQLAHLRCNLAKGGR